MFTLDDFISQISQVEKLGSISQILKKIPGMSTLAEMLSIDGEIARIRVIYNSMTKKERQNPDTIDANRRRRVARGAGVGLRAVCRFLLEFDQTRDMMKRADDMRRGRSGR